jgi:hypothetical protein
MRQYTITYFVNGMAVLKETVMLTPEQKKILENEKNVVVKG